MTSQLGINRTYQDYVTQYGEENADFLTEMLGNWFKNYKQLTYIDTGVGDFDDYKKASREYADKMNWVYEEINGDTGLIFSLLNGDWNVDDFLVVPPHNIIEPTNEHDIVSYSPKIL